MVACEEKVEKAVVSLAGFKSVLLNTNKNAN
jgi:hypothetical protein